ncbi:hypothetical protein CRENBAI_010977 [Crenichthys baileyi]|uniref:Uncharacterized protein n=1 Tax=Crenichthys baileyi TaxID=28760 RepID=A0AAV9SE71_9TELE
MPAAIIKVEPSAGLMSELTAALHPQWRLVAAGPKGCSSSAGAQARSITAECRRRGTEDTYRDNAAHRKDTSSKSSAHQARSIAVTGFHPGCIDPIRENRTQWDKKSNRRNGANISSDTNN